MKIRIVTQDNYETYNVTEQTGRAIVSQFIAGVPFTVETDTIPGPWGQDYRVVHYNSSQVISVETLDLTPPT